MKFILFCLLFGLAILFSVIKKRIWLKTISFISFVIVGIIYNQPVSIFSLFSLVNIFNLMAFLALSSVLLYRNVYCEHICPYNFIQKYLYRIPTRRKYKIPSFVMRGKYVILAIVAGAFFLKQDLYLEPFTYLFSGIGVWKLYIFPITMLILSVFFYRFWCLAFCPVGTFMRIVEKLKHWILFGQHPKLFLAVEKREES